ncbi:unnamed protein product [Rotaria sp. Silwood1]|nr:unnamed protein product [Rotaria sp. Silwood1]
MPNMTTAGNTIASTTTTGLIAPNITTSSMITTSTITTTGLTVQNMTTTSTTTELTVPNITTTSTASPNITATSTASPNMTTTSTTTTEVTTPNLTTTSAATITGITGPNMTTTVSTTDSTVPNMTTTVSITTEITTQNMTTTSMTTSVTISNTTTDSLMPVSATMLPVSDVSFLTVGTQVPNTNETSSTITTASVLQNISSSSLAVESAAMLSDTTGSSLVPTTETILLDASPTSVTAAVRTGLSATASPSWITGTVLFDATTPSSTVITESRLSSIATLSPTPTTGTILQFMNSSSLGTETIVSNANAIASVTETLMPEISTQRSIATQQTIVSTMSTSSMTATAGTIQSFTGASSSGTGTTVLPTTAPSSVHVTETMLSNAPLVFPTVAKETTVSDTTSASTRTGTAPTVEAMLSFTTAPSSQTSPMLYNATEQASGTGNTMLYTSTPSQVLGTETLLSNITIPLQTVGAVTLPLFTTAPSSMSPTRTSNTTAESLGTETFMPDANTSLFAATAQNTLSNMTLMSSAGTAESMPPFTTVPGLVSKTMVSDATARSVETSVMMSHTTTSLSSTIPQTIPSNSAPASLAPESPLPNITIPPAAATTGFMSPFTTVRSSGTETVLSVATESSSTVTTETMMPKMSTSSLAQTTRSMLPFTTRSSSWASTILPDTTAPLLATTGRMLVNTTASSVATTVSVTSINASPITSIMPINWNYDYYCRMYGVYNFPSINGSMLTIDDSRIDPINPSCFGNQSNSRVLWQYLGSNVSRKSSLIILSGSLASNQIYQFMVIMTYRQNSSLQATGSVLVHIQDSNPHMIAIVCAISTMCIPNVEYQYFNPTTQVALFSMCMDDCKTVQNITWNIYQGSMNSSSNTTQWILFNQMNAYQDIWFFGMNTSNFTAINKLFIDNPYIIYWRFEVVYSFSSESSSSSLNFIINRSPQNGFCSISPTNGTTSTLFTISCFNWTDDDGIKDYSIYGWTTNPTDRVMFAHSYTSTTQLLLSATNDNTSVLNIIVYIRDTYDCVAEFNMSSIIVTPDWKKMESLLGNLQNSTNDAFIQMLASGNQNMVSQIVTSLSQQFNTMNNQAIETAISNGISSTTIAITPLGSKTQQSSSVSLNASALAEYNKQLNTYANVRDSLVTYITNLTITTADSIKLQASSLAQFTQATNQLTRTTIMLASDKCYQLAWALHSMATIIASEDVQIAANYISQCANNVLSSVNGPLQQRATILDLDWSRANNFPIDYDTDMESEWSNPNLFADNNDFSWETIQKGRNSYYQKQIADQINIQVTETISLITKSLNIHLNIGQNSIINTSSILYFTETITIEALSNKLIQQVGNAQIRIPSNFTLTTNNNTSISLQSIMQPLALADHTKLQSNTNLSTSLSLTIFDRNGNEISFQTDIDHPIEFIILRDSNIIIPLMNLQNVTSMNITPHYQLFNLHYINIQQSQWNNNRTVALIFEMHPLNISLAYLLIYRFDDSPQLNSSINQTDGWTIFCPLNLTNDTLYTYFLNNQQTSGHQSVIFGLRELNSTEFYNYCINQSINSPPITNQPFNFTSNYELRTYTTCCYYLDTNNIWQTDGLLVGSQTNHYQTQCFSTHLTTFASGFLVLPAPINWNYVFTNADFMKNKTVYLTIICIYILYFLLVIYARYKDKKDIEKLGVTPLSNNDSNDQYFYQILVFTGNRKNAGTKSKVQFILVGDNDETSVRTFVDPHRKILQRGGIDAFIMAVPKSLGSLNYIRIWHDNTGHGVSASWFLKYIIVRDLQTMEKFYFICQQWFAVEKEDGRIERILPIAGELQKQEFSYVLSKQVYYSVSEGHLWFSIFSRPPSNRFTRVQRCTCCFVLLFTAMLLNILYYDQANEAKTTKTSGSLSLGPLYITPQQISIGIIVELLSLVPTLLLIQLFRRTSSRRSFQQASPLREALYKLKQQPMPVESNKKKQSICMFPWWFLFIIYGLSFVLAISSTFFIIARGIEFGDLKTQKWLTSLISGFFSSILLIQPLKIISLAIFFAFFIRNINNDKQAAEFLDNDDFELTQNEEYLHSFEAKSQKVKTLHLK